MFEVNEDESRCLCSEDKNQDVAKFAWIVSHRCLPLSFVNYCDPLVSYILLTFLTKVLMSSMIIACHALMPVLSCIVYTISTIMIIYK